MISENKNKVAIYYSVQASWNVDKCKLLFLTKFLIRHNLYDVFAFDRTLSCMYNATVDIMQLLNLWICLKYFWHASISEAKMMLHKTA